MNDVSRIELDVASTQASSEIEVHADSPEGQLLSTLNFGSTGGDKIFQLHSSSLKRISGKKDDVRKENGNENQEDNQKGTRDLYLVFKNPGIRLHTIKLIPSDR